MPTTSDEKPPARTGDRIAKLLARAGIASRREIERMIAEGRVAKDGVVLDTPATVLKSLVGVTVDGEPVAAAEPTRLFLFHKPTGVLTAERDFSGRPTIYDKLPKDLPRLVPVGRLDLNTEGLLLLTTDGELKRQLELPATGVERAYRARAYGPVTQEQLEDLIEGVEIEGVRYGSIDANLERRTGANVWIEMILREGKNREVRRVLEYLGLRVSRLIRTRYGPFILGDLPVGGVGEVKQNDLVAFRQSLKSGSRERGFELPEPVQVRSIAPARAARAVARPERATPGAASRAVPAKPARPVRVERPARPAPATARARPVAAAPARAKPTATAATQRPSRPEAKPAIEAPVGAAPPAKLKRQPGWAKPKAKPGGRSRK